MTNFSCKDELSSVKVCTFLIFHLVLNLEKFPNSINPNHGRSKTFRLKSLNFCIVKLQITTVLKTDFNELHLD